MERLIPRTGLAALFLVVGFGAFLAVAYGVRELLGTIPDGRSREVQAGLVAAFVVVEVKALLPQLLGAAALLAALPRLVGGAVRGFWPSLAWFAGCSAAAYAVVGPFLLTVDHAVLPGLHPRNTTDHVMTFLLCTAGVAAALLVARQILPDRSEAA